MSHWKGPMNILLVEDDEQHRELICRSFEDPERFRVHWSRSIADARAALAESSWHAILTDNRLPDGEGMELIRDFHTRLPVVLMTSFGSEELAIRSFQAGVVDYVVKSPEAFEILPDKILRVRREWDNLKARQQAEDSLQRSEERFRLAVEGSNDMIWDWDLEKDAFYLSERGISDFGPCAYFSDLLNNLTPQDAKVLKRALQVHLSGMADTLYAECRTSRARPNLSWILIRGKALLDANGNPVRIAGSITDITQRKEYEAQAEHFAYVDDVTGLPNRQALYRYMRGLRAGDEEQLGGALYYIDLDDFKVINDTFGHSFGDELLRMLGKRLEQVGGLGGSVFRIGGDEFALYFPGMIDRTKIERIADRLVSGLKDKMEMGTSSISLNASIGVVVRTDEGVTADELLKHADVAMYRAKKNGKNQYQLFTEKMEHEMLGKLRMEKALRDALTDGEIHLHYQPLILSEGKKLYGFEALARWIGKDGRHVPPSEFIPLAEETKIIVPLGYELFRQACRMAARINRGRQESFFITVNLSPGQLIEDQLTERFAGIMAEEGVEGDWIGLEITESLMMPNFTMGMQKMARFRELGIRVLLDDFGTGYSSLNYLNTLPVDILKIDRSFISRLESDKSQQLLTRTVIHLAHDLGLHVVAEGVETDAQLQIVTGYGCDILQGYLLSRPLLGSHVDAWISGT